MDARTERSTSNDRLWITAVALAAILASLVVQPGEKGGIELPFVLNGEPVSVPHLCPTRAVLGIPCPGCGLTRSFVAVGHGDIEEAFRCNPMGPVLYAICLLQIPYLISEHFGLGKYLRLRRTLKGGTELVTWIIVAGLIAQWIVRLLMGTPGNV